MNAVRVLDPMALFDPTEKDEPMVAIGLRVPKSMPGEIDAVVRLWKMFANARGDETRSINPSFVMRKLLRSGVLHAFDEFGGLPKDEAGWEDLAKAIAKSVKKSSR